MAAEAEFNTNTNCIYVPQGRCARLETMEGLDPLSLYTDGFSTCVIIAGIEENKILLIHADQLTSPNACAKELAWLGEEATIIMIYRDQFRHVLENLQQVISGKNVSAFFLDISFNGIELSLTPHQSFNDIHEQLKFHPRGENPSTLCHHPEEHVFTAIQKCEQIIGLKTKLKNKTMPIKQICIYDKLGWLRVPEDEKRFNLNDPRTKKEYAFFKQDDDFTKIGGKLRSIMRTIKAKKICTDQSIVMSTTPFMESFLHNFNAEKLFVRNMRLLLDPNNENNIFRLEPNHNDTDKNAAEQLFELLSSEAASYATTCDLIQGYMEEASETGFKKQLLSEFEEFSSHYHERHSIVTHRQFREQMITTSKKQFKQARDARMSGDCEIDNVIQMLYSVLSGFRQSQYMTDNSIFLTLHTLSSAYLEQKNLKNANQFFTLATTIQTTHHANSTFFQGMLNQLKDKLDATNNENQNSTVQP